MNSSPPLLQVSHLGKSYGGVRALDDVSFSLPTGQMLALIGPNGAGKSTCFNIINGQVRPDAGSVRLAGAEIGGLASRQIWRRGVGRTFQIAATFNSLTVLENVQAALLSHHRQLWQCWRAARGFHRDQAMHLLELVGMAGQAGRTTAVLAYGDVKRVELAMALSNQPQLLLMDEPTAGMAARERVELMALVRRLVGEQRLSVLFTEHSMDVVFAFADHLVVLARGGIVAEGDAEAIRRDPQVRQLYFGTGATFDNA
ncbi:ABC transporter ATP-binding protein [Herbaspirillum sp. YR522]|uniref:ABC transporter ATP-binding protein n=1 Tax=Herbaspirillum sp. YR522 TaxID=1144342 RepID=UPI00026FB3EB|nr:ABC transporter ATP-binding protein [Herbaspirillum sp. YR522]EJM97742.1 ABC-type branched-chain amino acid transport system, ATPase component [Herbaspirillum sp. YR522]